MSTSIAPTTRARQVAGLRPGGGWRGRLSVPTRGLPTVRFVFEEMNRQRRTITEVAERAGISVHAIRNWRYCRNPQLLGLEAVLNVLGFDLVPVPRDRQ
jgi:hypothetical protein